MVRNNVWVGAACVGIFAFSAFGLQWMRTSIKIEKFFSPQATVLQHYAFLESKLGALVPMELVLRIEDDCELNTLERMELVQRVQESVESLQHVGGTMSAVTFAPELAGGSLLKRSVLDTRLTRHQDEFVDAGYLRQAGNEQLWRISIRVGADNDVDYGEFVDDIRARVEPVLAAEQSRGADGISPVYTGLVPVVYKAQRSLLDGLLFGFTTDLLLIVVAIIVALRHWAAGLLITITSVFPAVVIFGLMSWQDILVDIGTVMAPSVALGVSVDDVVHFLLWFRRGVARGMSRRQAVLLAYQGCAKPMYQSWGVIGLGLSVFALSPFIPTLRFGALMVALLTAGLINNLLFLPALLSGPLGAWFARSVEKRPARPAETPLMELPMQPEPVMVSLSVDFPRPQRHSVHS